MSRTHGWFATCSSVIAFTLFAPTVNAQQYSLIELDAPATANYSMGLGINDNAQVVGVVAARSVHEDPTVWNGTTATTLDLAGGISGASFAINNAGVSVGSTYTVRPNGGYLQRATLWNGGLATLLPTAGGTEAGAVSINQLGQVVGWSYASGDLSDRAVMWDGATLTDLGPGSARDINNFGQVIGISNVGATLWNGTTATALGVDMLPVAINDAGVIVGNTESFDPDTRRYISTAKRWWAGNVVALTGPTNYEYSTTARDMNNLGQVVGASENNNFASVATLWNGTSAINLNTVLTPAQALHITLREATAINDLGYIVVNGVDTLAEQARSYILVPAYCLGARR